MKPNKYTKEQLEPIIQKSRSIAQALILLDLVPVGGNYATLKKYIKLFQIDTSHMTNQGWRANQTFGPRRPIKDYLSNQCFITSHALRERLIKEQILAKQCSSCLLVHWQNHPIPLELHHKDGNRDNNSLDNLCVLCPNCHAQTDNYRGKNIKNKSQKSGLSRPRKRKNKGLRQSRKNRTYQCLYCLCDFCPSRKQQKYCGYKCSRMVTRKTERPTNDVLLKQIEELGYLGTSRLYGVSDNAIRKWLK